MDTKLILVVFGMFAVINAAQWTPWFDRDNPSGTGDWETVGSLYSENPNQMCQNPTGIQCQTTSGAHYTSTGEVVSCSASTGLVCRNADQPDNYCQDYRVRFLCSKYQWTPWFDRDNPSGSGDWETVSSLYNENPNQMCQHPATIQCQTTGGAHYTSTGEVVSCSASTGLVCKNADQPDNYCQDYRVRFLCPA
ncbi:cartilage intermediate layer protein 2-like [Antedon mediterranea]|uniref:cartilage intermediate layer protein 2-like n=1 Tax=Antedon mediterranea TaxID=105859 RepID=UPI003AF599D6